MKNLFEAVPQDLFSILATYKASAVKNKYVYADALRVLYDAFRTELRLKRITLVELLQDNLANELLDSDFENELNEEENNISGRARFLVRKLNSTGWIEFERGQDYEEYVILPPTSIKLLKTFAELTEASQESSFSYVYDTYSALKQANSEKNERAKYIYNALCSAVKHTLNLRDLLATVYHNINNYCRRQAALTSANEILSEHYDQFHSTIIENYIKPLKLKESIPKYKTEIISIIDSWLNDNELLSEISKYAHEDNNSLLLEDCLCEIQDKLYFIKESYENFERNYIKQIDEKVRKYTRTTTQKLAVYTNSDSNLFGNLSFLMNHCAKKREDEYALKIINEAFKLSCQFYLNKDSLQTRKKYTVRDRSNRLQQEEDVDFSSKIEKELLAKQNSKYSKRKVNEYAKKIFGDKGEIDSDELNVTDDESYVLSILLVANSEEKDSFYSIETTGGTLKSDKYALPQLKLIRRNNNVY